MRATISRTGYTGEDGFEIFVPPQAADRVWLALLRVGQAGRRHPVRSRRARHAAPRSRRCGCYGNDIDETTTVARSGSRTGSSAGRRTTSSAPTRCASRRPNGVAAQAGRLRDGRPRHRAPRLRGLRRRRQGRRRHQRHADAVPEEGDRHGIRADRNYAAPALNSTSTSAAGGSARARRADAVLQDERK